jgi:3-deoxy-D-manno-octulosonic-acid transferase
MRRFNRFASLLRPFFSKLACVCIQENEHRSIWEKLGITPEKIHLTGSIKFDPESATHPQQRADFWEMLDSFGKGRPVILAASTFPGEEVLIASAIREADPNALPVIVPRHAERRLEVFQTLNQAGFQVTLRSAFETPLQPDHAVFVIDTTGELATWTAHADVVIIGKSFLSTGGQNPAEAILAKKPLILGPHMENFQPLVRHLHAAEGALLACDQKEISLAIRRIFNPNLAEKLSQHATEVLTPHHGATKRHLKVLHPQLKTA